ncbi:MAG: ribose 5-phosphate isomerase B [Chloroflexi bacterium]|nr:ribose 5-phosphate isomerase B [Chloroflexota bacterium]|tara:strand:+ start:1367 stop:1825 length:459 start_codon:yes stop_codon:yes gene_type:complete
MKVSIGADHGGFKLKNELIKFISKNGYDVIDKGAYTFNPNDDYPDFAELVAKSVQNGESEKGIILCGSGVGASITASKFKGVRSAVCHDTYSGSQGVEHDDMNVICLGARIIGSTLAEKITLNFLKSKFIEESRFLRRLEKVQKIELENFNT